MNYSKNCEQRKTASEDEAAGPAFEPVRLLYSKVLGTLTGTDRFRDTIRNELILSFWSASCG